MAWAGLTGRVERLVVAASAAVAVVLDLVATSRGPGLSPDSVEYLSAGVGLAEGRGLHMLNGNEWTLFPPGLPSVVAAGDVVGLSAETSVRLFTAACFAVIPVLTYLLLRRLVQSPALRVGATVFAAVTPVMLNVSSMAWSEGPFIVVTLLFALAVGHIWDRGAMSWRDGAVLVVLCWVAFMLRFAGVALVVAGVVALVLCLEPRRSAATFGRAAAFGGAAMVVPVLWMLRNHAADGTYLGPRAESPDSVIDVARQLVKTTGAWLLPVEALPLGLRGLVAVAVLGAVAALLLLRRARSPYVLTLVVLVLTYVAYLTYAQLTTAFDPIDSRLLSPIFIPLVLLACVALEHVLTWSGGRDRRLLLTTSVVLVAFVAVHFVASVDDARIASRDGLILNEREWVDSPLARTVAELPDLDDATVYSNAPGGLWAATHLPLIENSPWKNWYRGPAMEGSLETFRAELACQDGSSYLVWYSTVTDVTNLFHSLDELGTVATLDPIAEEPDGTVYLVEAIGSSACE